MTLTSYDPATGVETPTGLRTTTTEEVDAVVVAAAGAQSDYAAIGRAGRADLLDDMADRLDTRRDALVATAMSETGLPRPRLEGEVARTAFQLRLFAEAVREGGQLLG